MTSETYLDLTFDRSGKSGKRPLRPKLLKLTDTAIPKRNRKKTKTKTKERSASSVRDRIYEDPAYTDDISHLANPLPPRSYERRNSSSNVEMKTGEGFSSASLNLVCGSLDKRCKVSKEFFLYPNKNSKTRNYNAAGSGGGSGGSGGLESFGHDNSSSSDDQTHGERSKNNSITRRGRSLDRSLLEKCEKRRDRAVKQLQQHHLNEVTYQQNQSNSQETPASKVHSKAKRKCQIPSAKSYDETAQTQGPLPAPDTDVASTSNSGGSKMHIGRRFLRGEIGIKSFNYYLLKEGLKSSKRLVGKQRSPNTAERVLSSDKKQKHESRSEENIYEEIFFKDAPASDEENQNHKQNPNQNLKEKNITSQQQQQHEPQGLTPRTTETTPDSPKTEESNVFPSCDLCIQHCTDENCEYCYGAQSSHADKTNLSLNLLNRPRLIDQQQLGGKLVCRMRQHTAAMDKDMPEIQTPSNPLVGVEQQPLNENGNNNMPAAHILEFQSYNPNNPGVYKIETTPVAITGEYNPILQFQQSSTTSSTAATTPSDRQHSYMQVKVMKQQLQQPQPHGANENFVAMSDGPFYPGNVMPILTAQTRQRVQRFPPSQHQHHQQHHQQQQQQQYILSYNGSTPRVNGKFGQSAKTSSSSDSLQQHQQQQQLHPTQKYNTVARINSTYNVPYSDPFYGGVASQGLVHMHPLIYASSRPLGGSQILLDPYDQASQIYKSDSRASILSEYSLRSSDNSHRYGRYMQHRGVRGRGEISDSSLGDSLVSCGSSSQRRYFGSSESCRFGFECRRCSLDSGGLGVGIGVNFGIDIGVDLDGGNVRATVGVTNGGGVGVGVDGTGNVEKCSFSDACRYDCRNCDCSSSYFSSDFDEIYGGGCIPRKTAAGILPSDNQPLNFAFENSKKDDQMMDRKHNKYAKDFFKHVNDVKKSIYQSEMQRNSNSLTKMKTKNHIETSSDNMNEQGNANDLDTTILPLAKERDPQNLSSNQVNANPRYKPIAAPRTRTSKTVALLDTEKDQNHGTGAIPKTQSSMAEHNIEDKTPANDEQQNNWKENANENDIEWLVDPRSGKERGGTSKLPIDRTMNKHDRYLSVSQADVSIDPTSGHMKRHHRSSGPKNSSGTNSRRRDTPAAPPPSPATYSDLQELKANLESMQDDTKSPKRTESIVSAAAGGVDNEDLDLELDLDLDSDLGARKSGQDAPRKRERISNLHDAEEEDVFYDARSEDSSGTPAKQQQPQQKEATQAMESASRHSLLKAKGHKGDDFVRFDRNAASQQKYEEKLQSQRSVRLTGMARNEKEEKQEEQEQEEEEEEEDEEEKTNGNENSSNGSSSHNLRQSTKKDNNGNKNESNKSRKSINHRAACGDCTQSANDCSKSTTAPSITTKSTIKTITKTKTTKIVTENTTITTKTTTTTAAAMALNSDERNSASTTTTTPAATKEVAFKSKEIVAANVTPRSRKHGERRSKSSAARQQQQLQAKANISDGSSTITRQATIAMLTISCDTCCQIECDEREMKRRHQQQQQQRTKSASSGRTWQLNIESETAATAAATIATATTTTTTTTTTKTKQQSSSRKEEGNKTKSVEATEKTPTTCAIAMKAKTKRDTQRSRSSSRRSQALIKEWSGDMSTNRMDTSNNDAATLLSIGNNNNSDNNNNSNRNENSKCEGTNAIETITITTTATASEIIAAAATTTTTTADIVTNYSNTIAPIDGAAKETGTVVGDEDGDEAKARAKAEAIPRAKIESATDEAERKAVAAKQGIVTTTTITTTTPTTITEITATSTSTCTTSTTSFTASCSSDIAGVGTLSNSNLDLLQTPDHTNQTNRRTLKRQEYCCLDSSEAQSDDSHLTRDSITRESQNDELSSSTLDKIDVSGLPLPALPPKKRRTRQRASPSTYHQNRTRYDIEPPSQPIDEHLPNSTPSVLGALESAEPQIPSGFQQYVAKRRESLEASSRTFNEKLEACRKMHYHMATGGGGGGGSGSGGGGGSTTADSYIGGSGHIPTYLFGESYCGGSKRQSNVPMAHEEIFLNKSGWVQVNKRAQNENRNSYRNFPRSNGNVAVDSADMRNAIRVIQIDDKRRSEIARKAMVQRHQQQHSSGYAVPKFVVNKVEELIKRNDARQLNNAIDSGQPLRPGYRIVDPQLANILNERPGFLPVRNIDGAESPPPITPILSPPPAFQDSSSGKSRRMERRKPTNTHIQRGQAAWSQPLELGRIPPSGLYVGGLHDGSTGSGKGMVFSRSFEYDTRRPKPADNYVETFSRSFDGNLSERPIAGAALLPTMAFQRERSPNFSSLTGNSPNYLTKKDSGGGGSSRDSSPKYQHTRTTTAYINSSVKEAPAAYTAAASSVSSVRHSPRTRRERSFERSKVHSANSSRSRKSQFGRVASTGVVGQSDRAQSSGMSRFRSFDTCVSQRLNSCDSGARSDLSNDELDNDDITCSTEFLTVSYHQSSLSPKKKQRQRSLTPERNESRSSSGSLRKQRSLTPESRSITPEDRRKKGSQVSLMASRQSSSSRSNTLERKHCADDKTKTPHISRSSSSSSSYSGSREHEPQSNTTASGNAAATISSSSTGTQHRRNVGRGGKQNEEHRIRRSRSLQLSEKSPNRCHNPYACSSSGQSLKPNPAYQSSGFVSSNINSGGAQQGNNNNFPVLLRPVGRSQPFLADNVSGGFTGHHVRASNDMDKSHSFDFDYSCHNPVNSASKSHTSGMRDSTKAASMHLDFDKSRSLDDDYRDNSGDGGGGNVANNGNSLRVAAFNHSLRYLQPGDNVASSGRYRKSSPSTKTPQQQQQQQQQQSQQIGSPCNNFRMQRKTTSPQNYGTRLCDHELTYDKLRKSLDRSPIMDFCQSSGDNCDDYDIPKHLNRNRETINSGGNSELNFMNNDEFLYETPTTTSSSSTSTLKQQRSMIVHSQSINESPYAISEVYHQNTTHHRTSPQLQIQLAQQQQTQREPRESRSTNQSGSHSQLKIVSNDSAVYSLHSNDCRQQDKKFKTLPTNYPMENCEHIKTRGKSPWRLLCSGAITVPQQQKQQNPSTLPVDKLKNTIIETAPASFDELTLILSSVDSTKAINLRQNHYENAARPTQIGIYVPQTSNTIKLTTSPLKSNSNSNDTPPNSMNNKIETTKFNSTGITSIIHATSETADSVIHSLKSLSSPDVSITNGDVHGKEWSPMKLKKRTNSIPCLNGIPLHEGSTKSKEIDNDVKRSISCPNMNALQKFKRSLVVLNNNTKETLTTLEVPSFSEGATDASMQVQPLSIKIVKAEDSTTASVYLTTSPNRFGSTVWRSFKERRRPKNYKDNKCNNSDPGIHVKLDLPEQNADEAFKSIIREKRPNEAHLHSSTNGDENTDFHSLDSEFVMQIRNLRRAYSSTINDMSQKLTDSVEALPTKHVLNIENGSPESLTVRSYSQSRSLTTFDRKTTGLECDSHSATSNDEANCYPAYAEVLHNFTAAGPHELNLVRGTIIEILDKEPGQWWLGRINRTADSIFQEIMNPELGWFPKDFVRVMQCSEARAFLATQTIPISNCGSQISQPSPISRKSSTREPSKHQSLSSSTDLKNVDRANITTIVIEPPTMLPNASPIIATEPSLPLNDSTIALNSSNILRASAVKELLTTEINYVKLLTSICEGYLPAMTKRMDIFAPNSIRLIFSNIAAINKFQRSFLLELRKGVEQDQIAKVFIKMHKGFLCYSTYCNSYPRALIELESYESVKEARIILENCRESENLAEFPLGAHLLSPVQRICRYPLHLSEILKLTYNTWDGLQTDGVIKVKLEQLERLEASDVDLPDTRETVEMALEAMRSITEAVNEGKRHSETISRHQESFQNFKGPPLYVHSIRFFLQIEISRQKQNLWNSSYTLFLFDNQIVYSKRDIIKRNHFIYKGRIFIDRCRVVNVRDGKMFGQTIKNALRIYCEVRDKWYDFCFRSANRKQKFLHTLALERQFSCKALNITEMTGFDYALRERLSDSSNSANTVGGATGSGECSDQSDYEFPETECAVNFDGGNSEFFHNTRRVECGNNSLPVKLSAIASTVTLPKKFKSRDSVVEFQDENQTTSLGRKRLGIWFRKPKNSTSTPNLSPKHKPLISIPLVTQSKELHLGVINRLGNIQHNGDAPAHTAEI